MKNKNLERKNSKLAITSFVLSLIPLVYGRFLSPITYNLNYLSGTILDDMAIFSYYISPLLSILFGIVALVKIRKDKSFKGKKFAIIGIILSFLSYLFIMLLIMSR